MLYWSRTNNVVTWLDGRAQKITRGKDADYNSLNSVVVFGPVQQPAFARLPLPMSALP